MVRHAPRLARLKFQRAPHDTQVGVGWDDVDMIRLDPQIVGDLGNPHRSGPRQKLWEGACMLRIEMLYQHEAHSRIERQMFQKLRECVQPSRGRAYAHDGKRGERLFLTCSGRLRAF